MRIRLLKHVGWVSDSVTQHKTIGFAKSTNSASSALLC